MLSRVHSLPRIGCRELESLEYLYGRLFDDASLGIRWLSSTKRLEQQIRRTEPTTTRSECGKCIVAAWQILSTAWKRIQETVEKQRKTEDIRSILLSYIGCMSSSPEASSCFCLQLMKAHLHWRHRGFRVQHFKRCRSVSTRYCAKAPILYSITASLSTISFLTSLVIFDGEC